MLVHMLNVALALPQPSSAAHSFPTASMNQTWSFCSVKDSSTTHQTAQYHHQQTSNVNHQPYLKEADQPCITTLPEVAEMPIARQEEVRRYKNTDMHVDWQDSTCTCHVVDEDHQLHPACREHLNIQVGVN